MAGVSVQGFTDSVAARFADTRVGEVLLLENSQAGVSRIKELTNRIRSASKPPRGVKVMLAADQEGGLVQRLQGPGFDRIPSAQQQATMSDGQLARKAAIWGKQLKKAGIDINLAPVADVVPSSIGTANEPIGKLRRGYGSNPSTVAAKSGAFIAGMDSAGVATSVKHFPGLGRVHGNTDLEQQVVDSRTTRDDVLLKGFQQGVKKGADMVMVSTATYTKIDPDNRAAFSATVVEGMIRKDLNFDGVVISDDLGSAKSVTWLPAGERAVRFLIAGGDFVIDADPSSLTTMVQAVRVKAKSDPDFATVVHQKATRVITMKADRGMADCD